MKLTALEIKKQDFEKSLRGYDPAEVKSFLSVISNEWEHLVTKNKDLEQKIADLEEKIEHYEQVEGALHETLQAAKKSADTKLNGAQKEADQTVEKAEIKAESIIKEAELERQKVQENIRSLLNRRKDIIGRIRAYLNVALESVDEFADEDPELFKLPKQELEAKSNSVKKHTKSISNKSDKLDSSSEVPGTENIDELIDELD